MHSIEIKDISKKYIISRYNDNRQNNSIRESISNKIKNVFSKKTRDNKREEFWALRDVSFNVNIGDKIGIIGKNGAGKSTLLKILSRITNPTSGSITLNGRVASLLEVGTGFHPELTGKENIFLNGSILGMKKNEIKKKFDEIVAFSEIEQFLDTPVKRYSSGMYVRLAFSVAAHLEPEILLIDEVLAVGDAQFQKKCIGKMESASKEGRTILFVSHNMGAIKQLCSRAVLLEKGKVKLDSNVDDVISNYFEDVVTDTSFEMEFDKKDRVENLYKVYINKISFPNKLALYKMWEPINMELEIDNLSNMDQEIIAGLTILSVDEYPAFSVESEDCGHKLFLKNNSRTNIKISIPYPNLAPGKYFIRIGIRAGLNVIDFKDRTLHFEIQSGLNTYPTKNFIHGMKAQSKWEY
ncbi:MAG: polysaccharide ABC transporter ATP-binding protein [Ignavibacteria bacterium]|nr:polysaccharide ABC transporter ATP-binding protein [Ignavibacteria bacterium]